MPHAHTFLSNSSPFSLFSVEASYVLDWKIIDQNLKILQEATHPDLYPAASYEREIAESMISAVNNAYRTLKDPILRANTLFELNKIPIPGRESHTVRDPSIMEEALEIKEKLANATSHTEIQMIINMLKLQQDLLENQLNKAFVSFNKEGMYNTYIRLSFCIKTQQDAVILLINKRGE